MKKYILTIIAGLAFSRGYSQCSQWQKVIDIKEYEQYWAGKQSTTIGTDGTIFQVFKYYDTISSDGATLNGHNGGFFNWNDMGLWTINAATHKTEKANSAISISDRNYPSIFYNEKSGETLVCGYTNDSTLLFNNIKIKNTERYYVYVLKFDSSGKCISAFKPVSVTDSNSFLNIIVNIIADKSGNIYIAGMYSGTASIFGNSYTSTLGSTYFIIKMDNNGNKIWLNNSINCDFIQNKELLTDEKGNMYATIEFGGILISGTDTIKNKGSFGGTDVAIIKLDSSGKIIWTKAAGNIGSDYITGCAIDENLNVYACGNYGGTFSVQGHTIYASSYACAYIFSLDSNGQFRWIKPLNDTIKVTANSIQVIQKNKIIFTTNFYSQLIFQNVILNSSNKSHSGANSAFFIIDDMGNIYNHSLLKSSKQCYSNVFVSNDYVYLIGAFSSDITLDTNYYSFSDTLPKLFYWRLCLEKILDIDNNRLSSQSFSIYPNPSSGIITLSNLSFQKNEEITIYNTLGQMVHKQTTNQQQTTVNLSHLPKGIYFLWLGDETKKIVIE